MICKYCGRELGANETVCPNCGAPVQIQAAEVKPKVKAEVKPEVKAEPVQKTEAPQEPIKPNDNIPTKKERQYKKITYILLAIFLGNLGIHDFYAKYTSKGVIKIILTLTYYGVYISVIWAIIDAFTVRTAKDGKKFV